MSRISLTKKDNHQDQDPAFKKKKRILVVAPNNWSIDALKKYNDVYEFIYIEDKFQEDGLSFFYWLRIVLGLNFLKGVKKLVGLAKFHQADGILGADDFISCLYASRACNELGLVGARTDLELIFQHKYYSRILQQKIVPEYVPKFQLLNFNKPPQYPFFAKPIRGAASIMAKRIHSDIEFKSYQKMPFLKLFTFHRLVSLFQGISFEIAGTKPVKEMAVAEEIIEGQQCTLEGVVFRGKNYIIGITDSVMYPNSKISFSRFNFPSQLIPEVQQKMANIAEKLMIESGFDFGFYNIEFFYNAKTEEIKIIEVNPRMAFQFTDLYEKVIGVNTFEILLKMTAGEDISIDLQNISVNSSQFTGEYKKATSFVLRTFNDAKVLSHPTDSQVETYLEEVKDARLMIQAKSGDKLSDDIFQDVESFRLFTLNVGGHSEEELIAKYNLAIKMLPFSLQILPKDISLTINEGKSSIQNSFASEVR